MKKILIALAVVVGLLGAAAIGWKVSSSSRSVERDVGTLYRCPMHPQIVSDEPGNCPICKMALVAVDSGAPSESQSAGLASVTLDDERRRLAGARTVEVALAPFVRRVRTVGRVAIDETRTQHVHTKVQGWIEHLHAGAEGDVVRRGDALLTIYSPELLANQEEYLVALDHRVALGEEGNRLVASARRRLALQDMTEAQIEALETTRRADRIVTLYAPVAGIITARNVSHGERVESATSLLDIADVTSVWLIAELYESDLAFVHDGQEAEATVAALPGRIYRARIRLLSPLVDTATRTVAARIELDNRDLALRPGMFAEVALASDLGERLSVPKDAVLRSGTRDVVFVADGDAFSPREVALGLELSDRWEVLSGLVAGQRVLDRANFLIDSESKLRSAALEAKP